MLAIRWKQPISNEPLQFSRNFLRAEVDLSVDTPGGSAKFKDRLIDDIRSEIQASKAKLVIIDNITSLKAGTGRTSELFSLVKRLRRLKNELGLSILVLADLAQRNTAPP